MTNITPAPYTKDAPGKSPTSRSSIVYLVALLVLGILLPNTFRLVGGESAALETAQLLFGIFVNAVFVVVGIVLIKRAVNANERLGALIFGLIVASIGLISSLLSTLITVLAIIAVNLQ